MAIGTAELDRGRDMHDRPRAMAQEALAPQRLPDRARTQQETSIVASSARQQGTLGALAAGVVSSSIVFGLTRFSPRFRAFTGVSGKTALVVTPMFGAFTLKSHLAVSTATKDPEGFGAVATTASKSAASVAQASLMPWHTAANIVYDHPCKTIAGIAGPLYAAIFYKESTNPATANMLLSQRLIHTRVYGQAVAIATTVFVMFVGQSMQTDGMYVIDPKDGQVSRSNWLKKDSKVRHWYSMTDAERKADSVGGGEGASTGPNYDLLVPLIYAPLLPLMIIGLRGRVHKDTLTKIVSGTIFVALVHAGTVMFSDRTITMQ